ncbi:FAD-binding protein [Anaeromicrobium sediminis]|uniref:Oxidoreductase n=1 Tax=Anaeromicrobium sediminis TaxID=1478221 RepID=A0A267MAS0_9FIRM|nr:FAD-binding protein [Anaeromicrobium sediminis]PAB56512.1 oxidoreductase [Anaeromicrobium sediminis]
MVYDIVIVGGGPSGSTLARMLDEKYKVLLIDKRNLYDEINFKREKCCGGLLAPDAQKVLAQFGLGLPKDVIVGPQMFSVRSIDIDNHILKYYQRHYINVHREKFDRWLLSLVPQNVQVMTSCIFKGYRETEGNIEVEVFNQGVTEKISTKLLVGADGATSKVRRMAFENDKLPDRYVSIQKWYKTSKESPHFISIFDEEVTDFYSWVIQKEDYAIVGAAILDYANANEKFQILVEKLRKKGYEFGKCIKREGTWIMRPRKLNQINLFKGNVALIGEAGGFISPSSAEGISYALKSGAILADCINHSMKNYGLRYKRKTTKLRINIFVKNLKSLLMYNKFTRKLIMKTGVLAMEVHKNVY